MNQRCMRFKKITHRGISGREPHFVVEDTICYCIFDAETLQFWDLFVVFQTNVELLQQAYKRLVEVK